MVFIGFYITGMENPISGTIGVHVLQLSSGIHADMIVRPTIL